MRTKTDRGLTVGMSAGAGKRTFKVEPDSSSSSSSSSSDDEDYIPRNYNKYRKRDLFSSSSSSSDEEYMEVSQDRNLLGSSSSSDDHMEVAVENNLKNNSRDQAKNKKKKTHFNPDDLSSEDSSDDESNTDCISRKDLHDAGPSVVRPKPDKEAKRKSSSDTSGRLIINTSSEDDYTGVTRSLQNWGYPIKPEVKPEVTADAVPTSHDNNDAAADSDGLADSDSEDEEQEEARDEPTDSGPDDEPQEAAVNNKPRRTYTKQDWQEILRSDKHDWNQILSESDISDSDDELPEGTFPEPDVAKEVPEQEPDLTSKAQTIPDKTGDVREKKPDLTPNPQPGPSGTRRINPVHNNQGKVNPEVQKALKTAIRAIAFDWMLLPNVEALHNVLQTALANSREARKGN